MFYPFDSRKTLYKSKFGAVASGEVLVLRLLLHFDAKVYNAYLRFRNDNENTIQEIEMLPTGEIEDYRIYECQVSFDEGLYFYSFRYSSAFGEFFVTAFDNSVGHVSSDGKWWQLTCYDKDFATPSWLSGGLIYQIFPDRFKKSGAKKENVPEDRFINEDWDKIPEHRQNNGLCSLGKDYYGGDLKGITESLSYLHDLGVTCIYLNPIFEAHSNHRYNTADYLNIDPLLGCEEDLEELCDKAKDFGIAVILDGVFSHTGDDSIYFNKYKRYGNGGAYNNINSKYFPWYKFTAYPNEYHSWWGVPSLPEIIEENENFDEFITGKDGVLRYWMRKGIKGWRLDVADELPDCFLDNIRKAIKKEDHEGYLLGEVWEDASNKFSYGLRRRYLRGKQLDSVMNYPFSEAIISYICGGNGFDFIDSVVNILENYPKPAINLLMNHLGTHDTARILTRLGKDNKCEGNRDWQANQKLSEEEYEKGIKRLKLASVIQYTLPGVPSLYYGDEAGVEGYGDPFCRKTYPWGKENKELLEFYRWLGNFRKENSVFDGGEFSVILGGLGLVSYVRENQDYKVLIAVNRWCEDDYLELPDEFLDSEVIYGNKLSDNKLKIDKEDFAILKINKIKKPT